MFHFGLPSEKLDFQDQTHFINRYEKLLYFGSGTDTIPLPIAKNAIYVEITNINMEILIAETKRRYALLEHPVVEYSTIEDRPMAKMLLKWGENPGLTRYTKIKFQFQ